MGVSGHFSVRSPGDAEIDAPGAHCDNGFLMLSFSKSYLQSSYPNHLDCLVISRFPGPRLEFKSPRCYVSDLCFIKPPKWSRGTCTSETKLEEKTGNVVSQRKHKSNLLSSVSNFIPRLGIYSCFIHSS